jgi:O-antigen/teichoic acid export membrane protein
VSDFGRFVTVTSLVTIVAGLTDAGLTNIGVREFALREPDIRTRMLRNLLAMRTTLTLGGLAVAIIFAIGVGYSNVMVLGTIVAGLGLVVLQLQTTLTIPLTASLRLGWISALELGRQVVYVALVVTLVAAGAGLLPFFAASVAASVLVLLATLTVVRREAAVRPEFDAAEWRDLLHDTLPYAAASAIGVIYFRAAILILSVDAPERETGYFSAAFRVFEVIGGAAILLVLSVFPILARAARDDPTRLRYALQRVFEVALILGAGIALLTALGSSVIIHVIAGSGYNPSIDVLRIESVAVVASFLVATWGFALLSLRQHRTLLGSNGVALAIVVVLSLVLIPKFGAKGAAIAVVVTELSLATTYAVALGRIRPDLRVSLGVLPRVGLATGVAAGAAFASPLPNAVNVLLAAVVYAVALAVLRAVPTELREAFLQGRKVRS